jgi:hypothetical protein
MISISPLVMMIYGEKLKLFNPSGTPEPLCHAKRGVGVESGTTMEAY